MARVTQVQQIEGENEQQALSLFEAMLAALPDPRRRQGVRYPLKSARRVGIALSRKRAGWDRSYLIGLLTGGMA